MTILGQAPTLIPPHYLHHSTLFSLGDTYIFDVTFGAGNAIVSASNHQIKLYNPEKLSIVRTLDFHKDNVSQIRVYKDQFLLSGSKDGTVAMWDLRTECTTPAQLFQAPQREPILCIDVNSSETLLAAGTELVEEDAKVLFWDARNSQFMSQFVETHCDDITLLHFHPTNPMQLLTGSTDGLVSLYDVTQFDEDEAVTAVINSGSSVHRANFFGPNSEYVYCLTHIETLSLWHAETSECIFDFGDVRKTSSPGVMQLDYVIDCHYDNSGQRLYLLGGSNQGDINMLHVNVGELQLCQVLAGGHSEVVRSIHWSPSSNFLISGAEDAKLCLWTTSPPLPSTTSIPSTSLGDHSGRSHVFKKFDSSSSRHNPYRQKGNNT
ncbi:uncharacterized protein VTP21DRAFT_11098 [Calcarisporiella thermophila]|uniref:uncharacterized protein n=1 Tax=Calcarisporiella thermophila TaxID=911321 RepID=UPI003741FF37